MGNKLVVVTGPSGSGKTSIMRSVMNNELISFTTRPRREGEVDGKDYIFIRPFEFDELFEKGLLVEYTKYDANMYGLTRQEVDKKLSLGNAFFICDNFGFNQIKEQYDNILSIFLYADKEDCENNMASRGDSVQKINGRISTYDEEIANRGQYDYVIKNNRGYKHATEHIVRAIINAELMKEV